MKNFWGNKRFQGFLMGVLCCCLVLSLWGGVYAANRNLSVSDGIKVMLNGQLFQPKDAKGNPVELFNYNGTVYAPVRALCEQAGMEVSYDSASKTVTVVTPSDAPASGAAITEQKAREIALAKAPGATVTQCKRDWEDGTEVFEIELREGTIEYECEIEIATGKLLKWKEEDFSVPASGTAITEQEARQIALAKAPGAAVVQCKRDWEEGREVFEIELRKDSTEYECEIEIATGKLLKWEEKNH